MDVTCGRADGRTVVLRPRAFFYQERRSSFRWLLAMAPVCSNCGGTEFVWVNNLRTGTIGRGSLSIRSGGELSLGTRLCRGCGHADLFLKDPTILKTPHAWREGEFVPIPPRPTGPTGPPLSPSPTAPAASPPPPTAPVTPVVPSPPASAKPAAAPSTPATTVSHEPPVDSSSGVIAAVASPGAKEAAGETTTDGKRPTRRRTPKAKAGTPPPTHE